MGSGGTHNTVRKEGHATRVSHSCHAQLGAKKLVGTGTGGCTVSIPKKKAKGKTLSVQLTVNYQGAAKTVPLTFKVR
jgi:hypothetical protein